ncbi:hypothetical protein QTO34_001976 [Cnephaeus nilssonii]|uniref:Proteasome inhibitor PI31 subunit n=1 Tax=Cnephaeus nilssonii TaxID=3371016 RepID=A0AA40LLE8_CNENI|nr:hypothetical protein QTO34_001976 [Eptesicus nilssonii]
MAGLEVLFASAAPTITCAQDALVCFLHWELVTRGYYSVGAGEQPDPSDKKSELLPVGWNNNKDLYVLRYESKDGSRKLLVKAVTVEKSMIVNVLEYGSQQVSDLTLNLDDYIDSENLLDFPRTYRNSEELRSRIASEIITPLHEPWDKASVSSPHREFPPATAREVDPLRIHPQHPHVSRPPSWGTPGISFGVGGEEFVLVGWRGRGDSLDVCKSCFSNLHVIATSHLFNNLTCGVPRPGSRSQPVAHLASSIAGETQASPLLSLWP